PFQLRACLDCRLRKPCESHVLQDPTQNRRLDQEAAVLLGELLYGHRRAASNSLDYVVHSGEESVAMVDGDFFEMLHEKRVPRRAIRRLFELAVHHSRGMLDGLVA